MPIAGGMVWGFKCEIIEVDGNLYIKTAERAYHPKEKVMEPEEVVLSLQKDQTRAAYCRLLGNNNSKVRELWVERDKNLDSEPQNPVQ
jgi:hypothetical protein